MGGEPEQAGPDRHGDGQTDPDDGAGADDPSGADDPGRGEWAAPDASPGSTAGVPPPGEPPSTSPSGWHATPGTAPGAAPTPAAPLPAGAPLPPTLTPPSPHTGGGRSRRPVILGVGGLAAAVLLVGTLVTWAVASADDSDQDLVAQGEPIVNAADELASTEERLRIDLGAAAERPDWFYDLVEHDGISCWFTYPEGGGEPADHVRCGPVVFADSEEGTHWLELPVRFRESGEGVSADVGDLVSRRTRTAQGVDLRRPDGRDAPEADEIDLERPPAPVVDGDMPAVAPMISSNVMVDLEEPDDGRINGLGHSAEVEGFGTTDRIIMADARMRRPGVFAAPAGQEWLLVRLHSDSGPPGSAVDVSYRINAGDTSRSLDVRADGDPRSTLDDDTTAGDTVAALVPEGVEDLTLVVSGRTLDQRWSFSSGSRAPGTPDVLYRDDASRVAEGGEQSIAYTMSDPIGSIPDPGPMPTVPEYEPEPLPTVPEYEPDPLPTVPEYEPEPLPTVPEYEPEPIPTLPPNGGSAPTSAGGPPLATPVRAGAGATPRTQEQGQLTVSFDEARLHYGVDVHRGSGDELHTAGGPDRALLYLAGLETSWDHVSAEHGLGAESISLVLGDGTEVDPLPATIDRYEYVEIRDVDDPIGSSAPLWGFSQLPVWDVPAGTERATLRITPQPDEDQLADVEYEGTMEFELRFR